MSLTFDVISFCSNEGDTTVMVHLQSASMSALAFSKNNGSNGNETRPQQMGMELESVRERQRHEDVVFDANEDVKI